MDRFNIKLTLSYDGTNYYGSQSQDNGNTVEDNLNSCISTITKKKPKLYFSGRTDSGVHAEGQVVNFFTTKKNMSGKNWVNALNSLLPPDIRILNAEIAANDFNARKSCLAREYWYRIINSPVISALDTRYSAHYIYPLDIKLLESYCKYIIGIHDFTSFCALRDISNSKIRHIYSIKIEKTNDLIIIKILGSGFLYHMIRVIIGTLIKLHRHDMPAEEMKTIISSQDRKKAGPTYTARGLIFKKAIYSEEELKTLIG